MHLYCKIASLKSEYSFPVQNPMDQPVDPVAAVVLLNLARMIQFNFARMNISGIHVTVVGHEAGVAGLPAVEALAVLEN